MPRSVVRISVELLCMKLRSRWYRLLVTFKSIELNLLCCLKRGILDIVTICLVEILGVTCCTCHLCSRICPLKGCFTSACVCLIIWS
ncbi:hypothetical protein ANPL_01515 [Anaplasma platys]|uniref:Uncharacterized protein n=1 Tax=Anaplasma platys TaxID=949 RepID=A0A858PXV9_9RICK|nr:hypothetical protein ANPL_01515 [Anaplasma platys]